MGERNGSGRRGAPVTLREVAERAGVSRSAVSRAFTPGANVSAQKRAAIEAAARDLGYRPSALASALTTGRTKMIGLVSNNFHNPSFLEVFDQFTRGLQDRGLRPLLVNLSDETDPARSVQLCMSCEPVSASKVQWRSHPWQAWPVESVRPPKTMGAMDPSSSGSAIMMVDSTGSRPRSEPPHCSSVWNSTGITER